MCRLHDLRLRTMWPNRRRMRYRWWRCHGTTRAEIPIRNRWRRCHRTNGPGPRLQRNTRKCTRHTRMLVHRTSI